MIKEFKEFAMRGNVVDMAVGIIIGSSFGGIVKSLVDDVIMPPIGLILGNVDFSNLYFVLKSSADGAVYSSLAEAKKAGAVTVNYGMFLNTIIGFLIVAFAVFLLIQGLSKLKKVEPVAIVTPNTKDCPHCATAIPLKANRCPHCTSTL